MLILRAAQDVVRQEGFEELLQNVRDRIDEIESLHRTRELTVWFRFMVFLLSFLSPLFLSSSRTWTKGIRSNCLLTKEVQG